jgi:hypothetical protein
VSGAIYFLAVVLCIGRRPRPPKPTPPEVLEYEAWVREQLAELYRERAERVEAAFAPQHLLGIVAEKHHAFARWIQLLPNGEVRLAGKAFHAKESFQAVARDDTNIERAVVKGNGDDRLYIVSHGVSYQAIWTGAEWRVQETQTAQLEVGA